MMPSGFRSADDLVQRRFAGILEETEDGYAFTYDDDYLAENGAPVSLTLPLSERVYRSEVLFSFFDGLIPEGWLLEVVSRSWKIDRNDRFGLLLAACGDCIGDVSIRDRGRA